MDKIDLLTLVKTFGKLDGITLYGYIVSKLPRPFNLMASCQTHTDGFFVKMNVLAVNLQRYSQYLKQQGIVNKENDDIYLVNGDVALFVSDRGVYPDWYATTGTLRLGSKTDNNYLTLFPFRKTNDNWFIDLNTLDTMDIAGWNKQSRLYRAVYESIENKGLTIPDDVKELPRFEAKLIQGVVSPTNPQQSSVIANSEDNLNDAFASQVVPDRKSFEIVDRQLEIQPNELYSNLQDKLKSIKVEREKFIKSLKTSYSIKDCDDSKIKFLINSLTTNLKSKPHNSASTGRILLKKYLSKFGGYASKPYLGTTAGQYLIDDFTEVGDYILGNSDDISANGEAWFLCKQAFGDKELFYALMLGVILGVDTSKLESACRKCNDNELSFVNIITTNPYLLLLITNEFNYADVDYIAYCLGLMHNKDIAEYKAIGIIYDYLNNSNTGSTIFKLSEIYSSTIGVTLTQAKYNQCMNSGTYLSETLRSNIYYYLDNSITKSSYEYIKEGWRKKGYTYILGLSRNEIKTGVDLVLQHGLALSFDKNNITWISSQNYVEKEIFICEVLYSLLGKKKNYNHSDIDKYIDEYEDTIGFKLEQKQRDAVHLVDNYVAVITGPAGSGKTTVSDCMVYVLNKLGEENIEYAAPTGKAAKRLQEVVKKPVQTFNSKFKIFSNDSSGLFDDDDSSASQEDVVYFFDEAAMPNVNLMYKVCEKLSDCSVYLLGDICQLPPIGKGLPFKNFLRFLPCVQLNVTKRSAENSGITYNSRVINEYSENDNWQDLKEFDDFKLLSCADDNIKQITVLLCKYYLNKITPSELADLCRLTNKTEAELIKIPDLTPDDIQVVSPIGKQTYTWGTYQLNNDLQRVFNDVTGYDKTFRYQTSESVKGARFAIGDRVIHSDSNMYSMQWYSDYKGGIFKKTYGFGIANGDVGKIVAFYPSKTCDFEDEGTAKPKDFRYPDNLRDDTSFIDDNNWFIVVEYYDFMSDSNFYIIYRATVNQYIQSNECRIFVGDDLKKLNLFYAGTTHKMQGSQAKLIIGVLGTVNFKGFITRNMLYTEVTRASNGVYLVGSVGNSRNSQLSLARQLLADDGVSTLQELFYT